jgi:ketosteroid isomerase-like protein
VGWRRGGCVRTFGAMTAGARTPDELDALLEDALVLRDREAVRLLFASDALLAVSPGAEVRGEQAIWCALTERHYVARPGRVLRARETALVVAGSAIHVLHRGGDRSWRSRISLLQLPEPTKEERR